MVPAEQLHLVFLNLNPSSKFQHPNHRKRVAEQLNLGGSTVCKDYALTTLFD